MRLRSEQTESVTTILSCISAHGGAYLVLPVGYGKSVVAMTVARQLGRPVVVVAPAALRRAWSTLGEQFGVALRFVSHAQLSQAAQREVAAFSAEALVVVDECHRFRKTGTARYRSLARLGLGCVWLLMSATPAVRGLSDVVRGLALFDPLCASEVFGRLGPAATSAALNGVRQGQVRLGMGSPVQTVVGREVCARCDALLVGLSSRRDVLVRDERALEATWAESGADALSSLLVDDSSTRRWFARLLRSAYLSSPGAGLGCARRLLRFCSRVATLASSGGDVSRETFRRAYGTGSSDQEALLLGPPTEQTQAQPRNKAPAARPYRPRTSDQLRDARELARGLSTDAARHSAAACWLRETRSAEHAPGGAPTLVFSCFVETVRWLRTELELVGHAGGHRRPRRFVTGSWVYSSGAGRMTRAEWAAELATEHRTAPDIIATDCLSHGLDLGWLHHVVHLEPSYSEAVLIQREGRITRAPGEHVETSVVYTSGAEAAAHPSMSRQPLQLAQDPNASGRLVLNARWRRAQRDAGLAYDHQLRSIHDEPACAVHHLNWVAGDWLGAVAPSSLTAD